MTRCFCCLVDGARARLPLCVFLLMFAFPLQGQNVPPRKYSVQVSAAVQESPARITLSWPNEGDANGYSVSRRTLDSGWNHVSNLGGGSTSWEDANVNVGVPYEYQIVKSTSGGYTGYGYIRAGIKLPMVDYRGKVVLLVEQNMANALGGELEQLKRDLIGEGWVVLRHNVSMNDSPVAVKNIIKNAYNADPGGVKTVFLFGHVPVPYSGDIYPDGHENHQGAWPADVYYGDMDGNWTDSTVNTTAAERQVNWNTPGDGKFDQGLIPSDVELMVGRVDLYNMTCYANKSPSRSETDLMRAYLNKLHRFRVGDMAVNRKGLICDNFSDKGDDPIAGSAWRSFPGFFGANNVTEVPWDGYLPAATSSSWLWSYASGGGSYYYSMGVGTSDDFALQNLRVVFCMFMGSYFGDWNNESNYLRAALGSGDVLTASYSGFPHSLYFPMAVGETIGYAMRMSQNNKTNSLYAPWNQGTSQVHVSLMGDPTLRMHPVKPASGLNISTEPGTARLTWNASPDSNIQGYHVFRSTSPEGPFTRVSSSLAGSTSYTDTPAAGSYIYMVKAVKLEQSGSGTYYNPSVGITAAATITGSVPQIPPVPSLNADVASSSRVNLQWNDVANETGYKLERKTGSGGTWAEITSLSAGTTSYANEGLTASTEYFYRIKAVNDAGSSAYSAEVRAVTHNAPTPQPPAAPALQAQVVSHAQVNLSWSNVENETGYKLQRKTGSGGTWTEVGTFGANGTSFSNNGLAASTEYFYRVQAYNGDGASAWSSEVRATTSAAPQPGAAVTFVKLDTETQGNWSRNFGAGGYAIAFGKSDMATGRFSIAGKSDYVWQPNSVDPRALLVDPTSTARIASAWYGDTITMNLQAGEETAERFAMYLLDWDRLGRTQRVEVIDTATGLLLDTREVGDLGEGVYVVYDIRGDVQVKVTKTAGPNALVMGAFFGGSVPGPISDNPIAIDYTRSGNSLTIRLAGDDGQRYRLESTEDFGTWNEVATGTLGSSNELPVSISQNRPRVFFRAVNLP